MNPCRIMSFYTSWPRSWDLPIEMFKNIKVTNDEPVIEDVLREINRGAWTIGYTGQSPERLKLHAKVPGHIQYHSP